MKFDLHNGQPEQQFSISIGSWTICAIRHCKSLRTAALDHYRKWSTAQQPGRSWTCNRWRISSDDDDGGGGGDDDDDNNDDDDDDMSMMMVMVVVVVVAGPYRIGDLVPRFCGLQISKSSF